MSAKKSFLRKRHLDTEMNLQITSMADIFIIILVFMLKSYAGGSIDITPSKGLTLPVATSTAASADALKVEISESAILVEANPVTAIQNFNFPAASDLGANGTSKTLAAALDKERQRQLLIAKNNSEVKVDPRIIVVADERTPYSTIKAVLATAAVSGYTDFKLAVVNRE